MIPLKKTSTNGAYAEMANKAADGMIKNYSGDLLSKPALIAKTVRKAVTKLKIKVRPGSVTICVPPGGPSPRPEGASLEPVLAG